MKLELAQDASGSLAQQLTRMGVALDLRCGGRGTCGRCRVRLLEGHWQTDGKAIEAPCEALACRTKLVSPRGKVEIPAVATAVQNGRIVSEWRGAPLPATDEVVAAVDLGTTTLAAVKIKEGRVVARASRFNPQGRFGDNVITRIAAVSEGALPDMQACLLEAVEELLQELGKEDLSRVAVAGNTVITCLLHGIDPTPIGQLPFTPPQRTFPERKDLLGGLSLLSVPCISGYVGGDLTAGFAEVELAPGEMMLDIGTNCEIIFVTEGETVCAAAAAGPAFEGAGLSCGCRAADGAIDHVSDDGSWTMIGKGEPIGLCGSGIVDFIAVQRRRGGLNEFGRFQPTAASRRLAPGVEISERDLEQILKAKAAVWAGILTVEQLCGRQADRIFLAGGFAQFLDLENSQAIGMLPGRKYEITGNTSLAGAARLACDPSRMERLTSLINLPREIQLNTIPDFENNFIDGLLLP